MNQSSEEAVDALFSSSYVLLSTRRKNGAWVETPVWFAGTPLAFYVFSAGDAGKVKRLRNFSEVNVAPCSATGKLRGEWLSASATLIDEEEDCARAYDALYAKYGWQMRLTDWLSRIGGRYGQRQLIRIALVDN